MLDFEKIDLNSLNTILDKVKKVNHFFKALREIADENRRTNTPSFLSPEDVSTILGMTAPHLGVLRCRGKGPKFMKIGHAICYDVADVLDYINSCRRDSASTPAKAVEEGVYAR
jgi:hypothetical protein